MSERATERTNERNRARKLKGISYHATDFMNRKGVSGAVPGAKKKKSERCESRASD